jgi:HD-GYP domain-containing protein (c-di-GMP phosphodiesterase class II)
MADARLAEIVGSLSLVTEAAAGVGPETASRAAIVATSLAEALGHSAAERQDLYYASLLRYIGCTSYAHETAWYGGGDDIALLRTMTPVDGAKPADAVKTIVRGAGKGTGAANRVRSVARLLTDPTMSHRLFAAHCEQAVRLATRLGAASGVTDILGQTYERFDGKGAPLGVGGEDLLPLSRILHVAYAAVLHTSFEGRAAAIEVLRARRGTELDPKVVDAFLKRERELMDRVAAPSVWELLLESEPSPRRFVSADRLAPIALAFAHFVDLKSPFTIGHSVGVARLCEVALERAGATPEEKERARLAGLLHDLGRASVPNGIWDKPSALNPIERERVEQHAYHSERVLARTPLLADLAKAVGMHHERLDGSGYHRGRAGAAIERIGRILAAADVYQALREDRAHRAKLDEERAAELLVAEAKAGRLDREAVAHVLDAAGQKAPRVEAPSGLTDREVEVLVLLARGLTNKQIGKKLFISPRTVGHHVAHIYEKTKVKTRAAAALFAAENELASAK